MDRSALGDSVRLLSYFLFLFGFSLRVSFAFISTTNEGRSSGHFRIEVPAKSLSRKQRRRALVSAAFLKMSCLDVTRGWQTVNSFTERTSQKTAANKEREKK